MTKREILMERYEDVLFALMMDELAETEGWSALAENRRLKESGEPAISEEVRRRCRNAIDRGAAEKRLRRTGKGFARVATKVAVAALVAILLFTTAFAASENFRVKTLNMVMEVFDDRVELRFPSAGQPSDDIAHDPQIASAQLLEGFQLTDEDSSGMGRWYEYHNADDGAIYTNVLNMENGSMMLDTEDAVRSSITIQGETALLVEKGQQRQLLWQLDEVWFCYIITENVSTDALLDYAESIVFQ